MCPGYGQLYKEHGYKKKSPEQCFALPHRWIIWSSRIKKTSHYITNPASMLVCVSEAGYSVQPMWPQMTHVLNTCRLQNNKKDERGRYLTTQDAAGRVLLELGLKLRCHEAHFILLLLALLHRGRSALFGQLQEKRALRRTKFARRGRQCEEGVRIKRETWLLRTSSR